MGFNSAVKGLMSVLEEETSEFHTKLIYLIKEKKDELQKGTVRIIR